MIADSALHRTETADQDHVESGDSNDITVSVKVCALPVLSLQASLSGLTLAG